MQKILVPLDGSLNSHKALSVACDLAKARSGSVVLLHVLLHDKEPEELHRVADMDGAPDALHKALDSLEAAPVEHEPSEEELLSDHNRVRRPVPNDVLEQIGVCILAVGGKEAESVGVEAESVGPIDGPPAESILAAAAERNVDTIVMGRRGLRNIEAIALGSVSQAVGESADCTCITVT